MISRHLATKVFSVYPLYCTLKQLEHMETWRIKTTRVHVISFQASFLGLQ